VRIQIESDVAKQASAAAVNSGLWRQVAESAMQAPTGRPGDLPLRPRGIFSFLTVRALFGSPTHMPSPRLIATLLPILICLCTTLSADTVTLKSGEKLEGKILSETEAEVTMSVQITATIKDERVLKREAIATVEKVEPDKEAWAALEHLVPGTESLERDEYDRVKNALGYFTGSFPKSEHAALAQKRLDEFTSDQVRVSVGEVKLNGEWLPKEKVQQERIQIGGRVLLNRMKRAAAAGQLSEAMAIFDQLEKGFIGAASYPEAVELGRRVLASLKPAVDQRQAQLKFRMDDETKRLATAKGADRVLLDSLIKKERTATEATIAAYERAGVKWLPLQPVNVRSLTALAAKVTSETTRLNGLPLEKIQASVKGTEAAVAAFSSGDLDAADKALKDVLSAWPANELAKRTQAAVAEAKKAAAAMKASAPAQPPAPKPKSKPSAENAPSPMAPTGALEALETPFFKRPVFFILLAVVVAFGAIAGKKMAKSRDTGDNPLDQ
jgi:hypothetical protein